MTSRRRSQGFRTEASRRGRGRPLVAIACPGLDRIARGFESFSRECFEALSGRADVDVLLIKGSGLPATGERRVWTLHREAQATRRLARAIRKDPYGLEQRVFALGMVPLIAAHDPDVILFSDWLIGHMLIKWPAFAGRRFRLLFSNGGPLPPPYAWADHVQQLTPAAFEYAVNAGEPAERQTMLPLGLKVDRAFTPTTDPERRLIRQKLSLPEDAEVVISVAALNKWHKRLDYVVSELASLPVARRPHLVLLGQPEEETPEVLALARSLLGVDGFTAKTVPLSAVGDYYRAADSFVLASSFEAMGRAFLEALAHGLPVLAHDYHVPRFVLNGHGYLSDLTRPGGLASLIESITPADRSEARARERHRHVYEHFSWERLAPRYVELLTALTDRRGPAEAASPIGAS